MADEETARPSTSTSGHARLGRESMDVGPAQSFLRLFFCKRVDPRSVRHNPDVEAQCNSIDGVTSAADIDELLRVSRTSVRW